MTDRWDPTARRRARSVLARARDLSGAGRTDEAVALLCSTVERWRPLPRHQSRLADVLEDLVSLYLRTDQPERAAAAAEEAATLRRLEVVRRNPTRVFDLAFGLGSYAGAWWESGHREEAVSALREAASWLRLLVDSRRLDPHEVEDCLRFTLSQLVHLSILSGRDDLALDSIEEAIARERRRAEAEPVRYSELLVRTLDVMSGRLQELGRADESLAAIRECVELRLRGGPGIDASPQATAWSLQHLAERLVAFGRTAEAIETMEEAIRRYRPHAADLPEGPTDLADMLEELAAWKAGLGCPEKGGPGAGWASVWPRSADSARVESVTNEGGAVAPCLDRDRKGGVS
jgi:tetratricopeptide (TPR) repeat protein